MHETDVPQIVVLHERCGADGLCARVCPVRIFQVEAGERPVVRHQEECCACGQCVAACPNGAIRHDRFGEGTVATIDQSRVSPEAALQLLAGRRSVRLYRKEMPPRALLQSIMDAAGYAPGSPHHRIGWVRSFTIVSGEEQMRLVREETAEYMRRIHRLVTGWTVRMAARFDDSARAAQAVAPDLAMRLREWAAGHDVITYGAPAAVFAHAPRSSATPQADCDAALQSVLLMAHAHGLGACWNGLLQTAAAGEHLRGFTALHELLGLPAGHRCYAAATVGYPAVKYRRSPKRPVSISWIGG